MTHVDTTNTADAGPASPPASLHRIMALRDFRLLFAATSISRLGDQFALIATPWLLLQLTDDPLALGAVLALEGLPRAGFMLVGGAATDQFAPRRVIVASDIIRGLLTSAMAAVVLVGVVELWMLFAFALSFGLVSGFAVPAENSIAPTLVPADDLQTGNSALMGATQLAGFIGPTLAGVVIATFHSSLAGIGLAFGIDTVSFAVSAVTCSRIRPAVAPSAESSNFALVESIREGFCSAWADQSLRFVFSLLGAVNLFVVGPLLVGIPLLAQQRLPQGATAFGILMGAFAIGNLAGYAVAGSVSKPSSVAMRATVLAVLAGFGLTVASLGVATNLWIDAGLLAGLGAGNGYLAVSLFTWIQTRTSPHLLGRTMSLVTFASLGLVSVSQATAGAMAQWNLDALFLVSGALVLATTAWSATQPAFLELADSLSAMGPRQHQEQPS